MDGGDCGDCGGDSDSDSDERLMDGITE